MANSRLSLSVFILTITFLIAVSRQAKADFAEDATAIIEQLVEDVVATQVVPNTAAQIPLTCDLLPATIYAMHDKRYNGLPIVIRKEIADALGFLVYAGIEARAAGAANLATPTPTLDPLRQETIDILKELLRQGALNPPKDTDACTFDKSLLAAPPRAWVAGTAYEVGAVAANAGSFFRCSQSGTSAAGTGPSSTTGKTGITDGTVKWDLIDPWAPATTYTVGTLVANAGKFYRCTRAGASSATAPSGDGTNIADGQVAWTRLVQVADGGTLAAIAPRQSLANALLTKCSTTQASLQPEIACALGIAVRDAADGDDKLLAGDAQRALLAVAAELVANTASAAPGKVAPSFSSALTFLRQALANKTGTPLAPGNFPFNPQLVQDLAAEIAALTGTGGATVPQLLATLKAFTDRCYTDTRNVSASDPKNKALDKALLVLDVLEDTGGHVYLLVQDVQAKNYGAVASDAYDTIDAVLCPTDSNGNLLVNNPPETPCKPTAKLVRQFLKAATVYAIDSVTAGSPGTTASSDFRTAAVNLIEEFGGQGFRRTRFIRTQNGSVPTIWLPSFSLRASARPDHAGATSPGTISSPFLFYPSLDYLVYRQRFRDTRWLYAGFDVSLLDAFGPFWELATRNPTLASSPKPLFAPVSADLTKAFLLGFVVPRVEFEFGVPALTKNLLLGFGGALRFFRADQSIPATTTASSVVVATYCFLGQGACGQRGDFNVNNLEASIFVKYVP